MLFSWRFTRISEAEGTSCIIRLREEALPITRVRLRFFRAIKDSDRAFNGSGKEGGNDWEY